MVINYLTLVEREERERERERAREKGEKRNNNSLSGSTCIRIRTNSYIWVPYKTFGTSVQRQKQITYTCNDTKLLLIQIFLL